MKSQHSVDKQPHSTPSDEDQRVLPSFSDFGLSGGLLLQVEAAGFVEPSPIQAQAIPAIISGRDVIGQAPTGSGKTAAYVLPALHRLQQTGGVEIVVLTPTRELAQQVVEQFEYFSQGQGVEVVGIVGGQSMHRQVERVRQGAQVVVATPGRLLDHLSAGRLKKFAPHIVVLDEADEMLDMGFIDDLKTIFGFIPSQRQVVLFSATMPGPILRLTKTVQSNPVHVKLSSANSAHVDIEQRLYVMHSKEREAALIRLIDSENPEKALVFCRTRRETDELCEVLASRGILARAIHGELNQAARNQAMREIKSGRVHVLVGTDIASRGLDISDLSHVFNFHLPEGKERFIHRVGRTGRAGKKGIAITLATPAEIRQSSFFREVPMSQFTLMPIPSRDDLEVRVKSRILDRVREVSITPLAKNIYDEICLSADRSDRLCQFIAYVQNEACVQGPNQIGLSLAEVKIGLRHSEGNEKQRSPHSGPRGRRYDRPGRSTARGGRNNIRRAPTDAAEDSTKPRRGKHKFDAQRASR